MADHITLTTKNGIITGNKKGDCLEFLGIPYAHAERFRYAKISGGWTGVLDATSFGSSCPQTRQYHEHLEVPERLFYHNEFRKGIVFDYDENCLNLNIYAPSDAKACPVVIFIHGGGFNSGSNSEDPFRGFGLAARGIVSVFINYRVGVLGYLTHEEIHKEYGRDGNFGLDDQLTAIKWVKNNISDFGGDPDNITLMGQSAGAISIQYLCLNEDNDGLFKRVIMMSGGGLFPKFSLPRKSDATHEYWQNFMKIANCSTLDDLRRLDCKTLFDSVEIIKAQRKDNTYNTMPVVDGYLIKDSVDKLISSPLNVGYMIGYTSNDMFAPVMAHIGKKFGKANNAFIYYFNLDAPGDKNGAFHSSDLRYVFERLDTSWRHFGRRDYEVSMQMADYIAEFARTGDPNKAGLPVWKSTNSRHSSVMCFGKNKTHMGRSSVLKLTANMLLKGDPKAQEAKCSNDNSNE